MPKLRKEKKDQIKAFIFDFDGVILESSDIKTEAFLELFKKYPEHQQTILDYHLNHQGVSRYRKFKWIYETLLDREYTPEAERQLGESFSGLVFDKIMEVPFVPGASELLETLKASGIPAFIASGTPDKELKSIVRGRSLDHYFDGVYGSSRTKTEIIDIIKDSGKFKNSELLFIGDATTDYEAASARDLHFVARNTASMEAFWEKHNIVSVDHLMDICNGYVFS